MSFFGQICSLPDSTQLSHTHGVCPQIKEREACVDFGPVEYMLCFCFERENLFVLSWNKDTICCMLGGV